MQASRRVGAIAYKLVINGHETIGLFRESRSETDVIDFKEIDAQGRRPSPASIVLKRGVDEDLNLWKWREQAIQEGPDQARTDGQITLLDNDGTAIATYSFKQAWPSKYTGVRRDEPADDGEAELIEIEHEGIERA
jgi:T4-like virus tail tube protein gp19